MKLYNEQLVGVSSGGVLLTSASNLGSGEGQVYASNSGSVLQFKTIKAGSNITVTNDSNEITINSTGTGSLTSGSVLLQSTTPGTQQTGHVNISGDIYASSINIGTQEKQETAILYIVGSGTIGTSLFLIKVDEILRNYITRLGIQVWVVNSSTAEVGTIAFGTPGGNPGIFYYNVAGTGRSQLKQFTSTGGLSFGCTTGSENPPNQLILTTNGYVSVGPNPPNWRLDVTSGWVNSVSGYKTNGADYGEYFESIDGTSIPFGTSVVLINEKIRPALTGEIPIGVISATCSYVGDNAGSEWPKKYLKNDIGEILYEEVIESKTRQKTTKEKKRVKKIIEKDEKYVQVDEEIWEEIPLFENLPLYDINDNIIGKQEIPIMEEYFETTIKEKINPAYIEELPYIKREERPEWNVVGLLGKVRLLKRQPVAPSWIKLKDISDTVELWLIK
jgi:hypothetical protein